MQKFETLWQPFCDFSNGGVESGYMAVKSGYIVVESGYMAVEAGYMVVESGYMAIESSYMSVENGFCLHQKQWQPKCWPLKHALRSDQYLK
jgi:hypothetical protein